MKLESLKLLLIANDGRLAQIVSDMLREGGKRTNDIVTLPTVDAALAALAANPFHAVLFELSLANTAGLFQVTLLSTKLPHVPVIVFGPFDDETFAIGNCPGRRAGLSGQRPSRCALGAARHSLRG